MADKLAPGKIQTLKNQRRKAQTDMDKLAWKVDTKEITSSEAKRRRALYQRVIARTDSTLKSLAPAKTNKAGGFLQEVKKLSPGRTTKKLEEVRKKAGG